MAHYLVTGGAGFIGSHLVDELLIRGETVRVLDNLSSGRMDNLAECLHRVEFMQDDIRDPNACRRACAGIDYVLHHAALGSVPGSMNDPLNAHEINVSGTLQVFQAAREARVKRVVYASSSAVYGDRQDLPQVEESIGRQLSPYAVTKYADELYAQVFGRCFRLETIGLRYFNVFGPRQDPFSQYAAVIPIFVNSLLRGEAPVIHGDGEQTRDFTYVGNAVAANLLACSAPGPAVGEVFNIACGEQVSLNRLYERLQELLGMSVPARFGPPRPGDIRKSVADIDKAKRLLGFHGDIGLDDGLARSLSWYRENLTGEKRG